MADDTVTAQTDDELADSVVKMTSAGEKALATRIRGIYDPAYEVWRAEAPKGTKIPPWRSNVRPKYAMATLETQLANIVAGVPRCTVQPRHPDDVIAAKAMQECLDYYIAEDHLAESQPLFVQQGLLMGVSPAKVDWGYEETQRTRRVFLPDEFGKLTRTEIVTDRTARLDRPCFRPWSVYDCYWDPNGRDVDSCKYVAFVAWLTKDDLERRRFDAQANPSGYRNLDDLYETDAKRRTDSYQDRFLGVLNRNKGQFKVTEVWTDDACFTIGNDKVLLKAAANPHWHGRKPCVIAQTRPDLFELQGIPEVDLLRDIQAALHTLQNMTIDSIHLSVMRAVTYRAGSIVDPNTIVIRPQGKIPVDDHDDIRPFEIPPVGSDVYSERDRLTGDMERTTGVSAYLSGADSGTVDQTTATGVATLSTAANALVRFKASMIQRKGFQRMFELWGSDIQQYQTRSLWVEIAGPTGEQTWAEITPDQVQGDHNYKLVGTEENLSRQTARNEAIGLLNALTPFVQMGKVNPDDLIVAIGRAYELPNPEALLQVQQPQGPPPAAPGVPGQNGANGLPQQLLGGASMPVPVQNAIGMR